MNRFCFIFTFIALSFGIQTASANTDPLQKKQSALDAIQLSEAENLLLNEIQLESPIIVGVIDQGHVNPQHEDLRGMILDGSSVSTRRQDSGHGQFVTGIIAARTANGTGIRGAASSVAKVLYRKMDNADDVATEIEFLAKSGVDAINLSLGVLRRCNRYNAMPSSRGECTHPIVHSKQVSDRVVEAIQKYNVVVIAAAGNDSDYIDETLTQKLGLIVVGASDQNMSLKKFSNYGPGVSLMAPAQVIWGTTFNSYTQKEGTSYSAPLVTGAAALAIAYFKAKKIPYTPRLIKDLILDSATPSKKLIGFAEQPAVLNAKEMARRVQAYVQQQ